MPNVVTSITYQVTLLVNLRHPLIKDLKSPRWWDLLVASLKLIHIVIFLNPIIGQLEELKGRIFNIMGFGPARSKRGNLGPCPRPWRGVVTDSPTHSY